MGLMRFFLCLQARFSPQNFVDNIKNALDILHAEVWKSDHPGLSCSIRAVICDLRGTRATWQKPAYMLWHPGRAEIRAKGSGWGQEEVTSSELQPPGEK